MPDSMIESAKQLHDQPLVSVLITTYNLIEFVREALDSALNQDYDNLEIIVADDASTDGTADVIREYAAKYPQKIIPLFGEVNVGFAKNTNRALKEVKGKYLVMPGGDDILLPGKISKQVAWLEADPQRILCGHDTEIFFSRRR